MRNSFSANRPSHATRPRRHTLQPLALAALMTVPAVQAQTAAPAAPQTVVITGNPLGREAGAAPVSVLAGNGLLLLALSWRALAA